jgi:hypothetical protein
MADFNGNGILDTRISMAVGNVIGVVQDTNVIGADVFTFTPISPIP